MKGPPGNQWLKAAVDEFAAVLSGFQTLVGQDSDQLGFGLGKGTCIKYNKHCAKSRGTCIYRTPHPNRLARSPFRPIGQYTKNDFPITFSSGNAPHVRESELFSVLSPIPIYEFGGTWTSVFSSGNSLATFAAPISFATVWFTWPE